MGQTVVFGHDGIGRQDVDRLEASRASGPVPAKIKHGASRPSAPQTIDFRLQMKRTPLGIRPRGVRDDRASCGPCTVVTASSQEETGADSAHPGLREGNCQFGMLKVPL